MVEWELKNFWAISVSFNELVWDVFTVVHKELDHTNFKWGSARHIGHILLINFDSSIGIGNDCLSNHRLQVAVNLAFVVEEIWVVLGIVINAPLLVKELVSGNIEGTFSQSACLTDANVVKHSTNLNTLKIFDEDVIFFHLVG